MAEVQYRENGKNQLLRHFLCLAWDQQCYWCRQLKNYLDVQIDHILPKTVIDNERFRLRQALRLPDNYDVHAPYNLALICAACNSTKGSTDFTETGLVLSALQKAQKLAPEIARRVAAFPKASKLAGALLQAAEADLTDASTRETFVNGAAAVVQRLGELEGSLTDSSPPESCRSMSTITCAESI